MSDVSPSLVEAAARAIAAASGCYPTCFARADCECRLGAEAATAAVLDAVGDALRLEGAQAEREALAHYASEATWERDDGPGPEIDTVGHVLWWYFGDGTGRPPWEVAREALDG